MFKLSNKTKKEVFVPILDHPTYFISNKGQVISAINGVLKMVNQYKDMQGYKFVIIYKDNIRHHMTVHRTMFAAWNPDVDISLLVINHKDGVKDNNDLSNVEACTQLENIQDAITRKVKPSMAATCVWDKPRSVIISKDGKDEEVGSMGLCAKKFGVTIAAIYNACTGRQVAVKGYKVRYK